MEITKTLHPGDMGTVQLHQQYGEQLVCVRYRVDKLLQKRLTTVELIVDEQPYRSRAVPMQVWVKVNYDETELRQQVKAAGAKWLIEEKVWEMDYTMAKKLQLKKRIVKRAFKPHG